VVDPSKKVPDLSCEVVLEVVDLKQEVPDLRSGGIPLPNLTPVCECRTQTDGHRAMARSGAARSAGGAEADDGRRETGAMRRR